MSEAALQVVQVGRETTVGTSVPATQVFPIDAGFTGFELDRASESPDEDYGGASRERPGRGSTGVRGATASATQTMCFEDFQKILEMHAATITAPSGGGPYVWAYPYNELTGLVSGAVKHYTWEYGDPASTQDEWEAASVVINDLEISFDALSAPGNSMWKASMTLLAVNRAQAAMTGALAAPATRETMEGHLTTFAEGSTATAFASLSALGSSLKQFSLRSSLQAVIRAYGGASDVGVSIGRSGKATVEGSALIAIGATSLTNLHDIYNVSGSVPTERRWRLTIDGSGNNVMTIDLRPRITKVDKGDHEGEHLYAVDFVGAYDATLASRGTYTLTNDVAAHA